MDFYARAPVRTRAFVVGSRRQFSARGLGATSRQVAKARKLIPAGPTFKDSSAAQVAENQAEPSVGRAARMAGRRERPL